MPPAPSVPSDPSAALRAHHGVAPITARTAVPGWGGERLDVGWALDVLRPPANPVGELSVPNSAIGAERPDQESGHDDILFDVVLEDDQDPTPAA